MNVSIRNGFLGPEYTDYMSHYVHIRSNYSEFFSLAGTINKFCHEIAEEETDETIYFLELLKEISNNSEDEITSLISEANELLAIFVASIKTAKSKQ